MKKITITAVLMTLVLASASTYAGHRDDGYYGDRHVFRDKARVVKVEPIMEVVRVPTEHRECWDEEVEYRSGRDRSGVGTIVGSIIGGVAGHQMGAGNGKKVATVAGTVLGAAVGNEIGRSKRTAPYTETQHRCRVTHDYYEEERVSGYWVTLRYRGEEFTQRMDDEPGKFVPVRIAVVPLAE